MSKKLNKIIGESGIKYSNYYVIKDHFAELHICASNEYDIVFIIDINSISMLKSHFWQCVFSGKNGYKRPQIFRTGTNGKKIYLNRVITEDFTSKRVIFINRNPYDYRRANLYGINSEQCELRDRNKYNQIGMNNIRKLIRNDRLVAFQVTYKEMGKNKAKSFNIEKYGGEAQALIAAKQFRDTQLKLTTLVS